MGIRVRQATPEDIPVLQELIDASVRCLQAHDYTPAQIDRALKTVYGVDSQLIADGTYLVAETEGEAGKEVIVGCGGWSKRKTLFGGDHWSGRQDALLNPRQDPAKIRAFFVHPSWARRGIGSMILNVCEAAAIAEGFSRLEMGATLSGIPFYKARGYVAVENVDAPLGDGLVLQVVRMAKDILSQD